MGSAIAPMLLLAATGWDLTGLQLLSTGVWLSVEGDTELCCRAAGGKRAGERDGGGEMQPSRSV